MARRGENIYKRKDKRWEGRFIKNYDEAHKAKYVSVYGHTYAEVKDKLDCAKRNIEDICSSRDVDKQTLKDYAENWLESISAHIKKATFVTYTNLLHNHIVPELGSYKISELTTEIVKNFAGSKLLSGNIKDKSSLSVKTVKDILSVLKLVLKYAAETGAVCNCNFEMISIRSGQRHTEIIHKSEQVKLVKYLLENIDNTKLGILICLYTGLRIGEICALQFEDISLDEQLIYVNKTMQRLQTLDEKSVTKTEVIISTPKSESSYRAIPIPDFLTEIIKDFAIIPHTPHAFVLTGREDKYVEPRTMENRFNRCLEECGLGHYNFHQLRHRFATYCVELGFDIRTLSEILGHSSVNITLNRYVHSSLELKRSNMNKLQSDNIH